MSRKLAAAAAAAMPASAEEERALGFPRNDPQMRHAFFDKIAGPVMNKMFECGMIP